MFDMLTKCDVKRTADEVLLQEQRFLRARGASVCASFDLFDFHDFSLAQVLIYL